MRNLAFSIILLFLFSIFSTEVYARSGCCSHHRGVCGCGCCDGTSLSQTCAPYYPECSGSSQTDSETVYATNTPIPWPTWTPRPPTRIPIPTRKPTYKIILSPTPTEIVLPTLTPKIIQVVPTQADVKPVKEGFWSWLLNVFGR